MTTLSAEAPSGQGREEAFPKAARRPVTGLPQKPPAAWGHDRLSAGPPEPGVIMGWVYT